MKKKNIIQIIADKEMDRREFLKYGGLTVLGLIGLKSVASLLMKSDLENKTDTTRGFGGGKYGA